MRIDAIHIRAPGDADVRPIESIRAFAGKGLEGDRYFYEDGAKPGLALTLIEAGVVADVGLRPGQTRRQLTVSGEGLNDLVGRRFRVGEVECYGVELCEPCLHLQELTRPGIIKELVHRAGLNADILSDGIISVGDEVAGL
jgi:MOSC domain-containing protein YiiM